MRYLTLALLGQAIVYAMHGLLTRTADWRPILFILYGPASRVVMAALLLLALLKYGTDILDNVGWRNWMMWTGGFLLFLPAVAALAISPFGTNYYVRAGMEAVSITLYLVAIGVYLYRRINTPLMFLYLISLILFIQSSSAFILVQKPWNHMFWLAHLFFASGFFILNCGLIRAYQTSTSFTELFNEDLMTMWLADQVVELKNENKRRRKAEEEAESAHRAKSELMANMSHELRTPLNAIIGFSGTIKEETFGPIGNDKYREYLDDIHYSGQHLLELINDILDASAIEAGALELHEENVSLSNVVEASVRIIRPRADKGQVTVTSSIGPEIPQIYIDKRRVMQVLLNLLSNAVNFTPEGGEVSISSWLNEDGSLAIAVGDTGIGMDEEEVKKALSAFGQVDSGLGRKHEGSGLGLPLSKGLIELHGGTLEIKSEKGHGTLVTVTFPKERVGRNVSRGSG